MRNQESSTAGTEPTELDFFYWKSLVYGTVAYETGIPREECVVRIDSYYS